MATDDSVLSAIHELAEEEHQLRRKESERTATELDRQRVTEIEVELDRCWDLLRQRRARRHAGQDPDEVAVRSESTVEHYQQ